MDLVVRPMRGSTESRKAPRLLGYVIYHIMIFNILADFARL